MVNESSLICDQPPVSRAAEPAELASSAEMNRLQWKEAEADLTRISALESDWDGDGAAKPSIDAVATARAVLSATRNSPSVPPPTFVSATGSGRIALEWSMSPSSSLVVEIRDADSIRTSYCFNGGATANVEYVTLAEFIRETIPGLWDGGF